MLEKTLKFFGLKEDCFQINFDPKYFFESIQHREAYVRMKYSIDNRYPFYLLTGYPGSGKTIITKLMNLRLCSETDRKYKCIYIESSFRGFNPLFKLILNQITGNTIKTNDEYELYELFKEAVNKLNDESTYLVIFLDESQGFKKDTLESIRQLTNISGIKENFMTICLIGQLELEDNIKKLKQLDQRILLRFPLSPLDIVSTEQYIYYRLATAGCKLKVFTEGAIEHIYITSNGVPREINKYCNLCLDAAYLKGIKRIDKHLSESALRNVTKHNIEEEEKSNAFR